MTMKEVSKIHIWHPHNLGCSPHIEGERGSTFVQNKCQWHDATWLIFTGAVLHHGTRKTFLCYSTVPHYHHDSSFMLFEPDVTNCPLIAGGNIQSAYLTLTTVYNIQSQTIFVFLALQGSQVSWIWCENHAKYRKYCQCFLRFCVKQWCNNRQKSFVNYTSVAQLVSCAVLPILLFHNFFWSLKSKEAKLLDIKWWWWWWWKWSLPINLREDHWWTEVLNWDIKQGEWMLDLLPRPQFC